MDFYNKFDDKYEINVYLRTTIIVVLFFLCSNDYL